MMQSCALGRRIEIALEFGREILQFHSDNRNIRCRGPSLSLCRKSPNILDIRHHSQIRRLRLARAIWLLSAWFRFRPNAAHEARRPLHQPRSATTLFPASARCACWTKPLRGGSAAEIVRRNHDFHRAPVGEGALIDQPLWCDPGSRSPNRQSGLPRIRA